MTRFNWRGSVLSLAALAAAVAPPPASARTPGDPGAAPCAALEKLAVCNDVQLLDWVGTDHLNTWHETLPGVRDWFDSF